MTIYLIIDNGDEGRPYLGAAGMQPIAFNREEDAQQYTSTDEALVFVPVEVTSPDLAADARKPYADILKSAQFLSEHWSRQAADLQREAMRSDVGEVAGVRKAERAAGLHTASQELRRVLGLR